MHMHLTDDVYRVVFRCPLGPDGHEGELSQTFARLDRAEGYVASLPDAFRGDVLRIEHGRATDWHTVSS